MKKIAFLCALLMLLTACGTAENAAETTAVTTSEATSETTAEVTESTTETTAEVTETTTEITAAEEVAEPQEDALTVSPGGYVLDPANIAPEYCNEENGVSENTAYFLGTPMEGVNMYGVNASADKAYEKYTSGWGEDTSTQYIVAEHDGAADELPVSWIQRYGNPINMTDNIFCADFDGDGETEIAISRCSVTGTFCCIYELTIFKLIDGHYKAYTLNSDEMLEGMFSADIDDAANTVKVTAQTNGAEYTYNYSEAMPDGVKGIDYGSVVGYAVEGDKITAEVPVFMVKYMPDDHIDSHIEVKFTGSGFEYGEITFSTAE